METNKELTGYPSIDKPWLKFYDDSVLSIELPKESLYEYLRKCTGDKKSDIALEYFGKKITYQDLFTNIDSVAESFKVLGVSKSDTVVLALPNIPENVYCAYALNKLGAVADFVDLRSKGEILVKYIREADAKVIVVCDLFANNILEIMDQIDVEHIIICSVFETLSPFWKMIGKIKCPSLNSNTALPWKKFKRLENEEKVVLDSSALDTAFIFHTSGTTGNSKGVMLSNYALNAMTINYRYCRAPFEEKERLMNQVPPFLAYNVVLSVHLPLVLHMTVVMLPNYEPEKFVKNIIKIKPNHVFAGPADWSNFLSDDRVEKNDFSYLKTLASGSDIMSVATKKDVNNIIKKRGGSYNVLEGYGMTECGSAACSNLPQCDIEGSIGIPLPLNTICIYDSENNQELSYGLTGEICISGPTVMLGYRNNPDETAKVLKVHDDGRTWLHSGDLGHMTKDGCVWFEGRVKRLIVRYDGIKISPNQIEEILRNNPCVKDCCVVGKKDSLHGMGSVPIAYVVRKEKVIKKDFESELLEICRKQLEEKYCPAEIVVIDELPLTSNGKVDYRNLEKR